MHSRKLKWASPLFIIFLALASVFGATSAIIGSQKTNEAPVMEKAEAADYSSTIRVYVDLEWDNIEYVRIGGNSAGNNAVLTTSNTKYRRDCGKYVLDISSGSTYDRMGCFFKQGNDTWQYQYDGGYIWIDGSKFQPGYEFKISGIGYVSGSNPKLFQATPTRLGKITDCVNNATVYFVNGYSWATPTVYYWGGTASADYPGSAMTATDAKLHCKVGDTWYDIGIFKYTISGTAAFIQFNKGDDSQKTGDLNPESGSVYWYGVDADKFGGVASFLVSFINSMGSHTYNGKTYPTSLCAFSSSTASSFVSSYNTLSTSGDSDVVTSINNSTIKTYSIPVTSPSTTSDITVPVLMEQVNKISSGSNYAYRGFNLMFGSDDNNVTTIIIVVASSVALLSVTALSILVIKKRKQKEE